MDTHSKSRDYMMVKVEGYNANNKYMYARTFPQGEKITIAVQKNVKTDFIGYLSDKQDKRFAPKGSIIALYNVDQIKDAFHVAKWAKTVSKKPQSEDVIVSPTTVSPVIDTGNGKTQVLARIVDPVPLQTEDITSLQSLALSAIKNPPANLNLPGNRGFMLRVGLKGQSGYQSASFKGLPNSTPEKVVSHYFGGNGSTPSSALKSILAAAQSAAKKGSINIEVVAFTDAPVFNYGNSQNDHKLASIPNFRISEGDKYNPTFSNAAITIDRQDNNKVLSVVALPDKKIISDLHALVGSHSKTNTDTIPFILPKQFPAATAENKQQASKEYPVSITPYIDKSNQQFNTIFVQVRDDAPKEVHDRVLNAIDAEPRKGAGGYYFNRKDRKKVESSLSDLAGTPALYTATGSIDGESHTFIAGRTNDPEFKGQLEAFVKTHNINSLPGGLYSIPDKDSIQTLSAMEALLKKSASSKLASSYLANKPKPEVKQANKAQKKPTYVEWLDEKYRKNPDLIAREFDSEIADKAEEAGIIWSDSKGNVTWPSLNGKPETVGKTANVKPVNTGDNGSCYISTMFNSWNTAKGNEQYGIVITFTNLNKDREERWSFNSHSETYKQYSEEVWGNEQTVSKKHQLTDEELAEEKRKLELENEKKRAQRVAASDAQKNKAFNDFTSMPLFVGSHKTLEDKQLPNFAKLVDAKALKLKSAPNNKAFAFAAYDIHERFVGYQYITEDKILLNKDKPEKKNSWSNKMFNYGFQKDDVRSGLPLGTHRTLGTIDPNNPHNIYYSEGYANAGSNHEVTNEACVICFDKDNMKKVIGLMSKKYPNHRHIHVSDNDRYSPKNGNVGVMSALDSAYHFGALVVIPNVEKLPNALQNKFTDTSDFFTTENRETLKNELINQQNLSDVVVNHLERVKYVADSKIDQQISLLSKVLDEAGVDKNDKLAAINEVLQLRTDLYAPIVPQYAHKYSQGFSDKDLETISTANNSALDKIDYDLVENAPSALKESSTKAADDEVSNNSIPEWPVQVQAVLNPSPKEGARVNTITEISDPSGEYTSFIIEKLQSLDIPHSHSKNTGKIYAPYKFINLINSGLNSVTGAPAIYPGRTRSNEDGVVIRGDFTNSETTEDLESVLKPLGISYNQSEMGYVIADANTYVFVKEVLQDKFMKANPDAIAILPLELNESQVKLTSNIEQVAFSLGLQKQALAKQQLKLNQHNPQLAELNSPIIAGVYYQAESKVKHRSDLVSKLSPAERVYMQQRTLQTMLGSLNLTQPTLEKQYREDVDSALSILKTQMAPISPSSSESDRSTSNEQKPSSEEKQVEKAFDGLPLTSLQQQHAIFQTIPQVVLPQSSELTDVKLNQAVINKTLLSREAEDNATSEQENEEDLNGSEIGSANEEPVADNLADIELTSEQSDDDTLEKPEASTIVSIEVEAPQLPHKSDVEIRLDRLVDFIDTYLANEYTPEEINESLREPGSPYYDIASGFQYQLLRDDVKKSHTTRYGKLYNLPRTVESPFVFISSVEKTVVESRLAKLDLFIDEILKHNPNFTPKRVSAYAIRGAYRGVHHPYMDDDGNYNKALLKNDLMHIDGYEDITTLTGYFALQQEEYLDGQSDQHGGFSADYDEGELTPDDKASAENEDALVAAQVKLMSSMPAPPASLSAPESEKTQAAPTVTNKSVVEEPKSELIQDIPHTNAAEIFVNNDNDTYSKIYKLAIICAQEEMSYEEFYEAVFTQDGAYYTENPFVIDGKLDKKSVVKELKPNGFTSPKRFFESAFEDVQGKPQSEAELSRVAGIFPSKLAMDKGIGSQFNAIETLLIAESPLSLEKAQEITKKSFASWYRDGDSVIAIHPIFAENLQAIDSATLAAKYSDNEIKLMADVMCVPVENTDAKEYIADKIITQWKTTVELGGITQEDFQELPSDEIHRIADVLKIPITPAKADMARMIYNKVDDINQLVELRIAQYSYVISALTLEKENGKVPSFVYRQLDSILAEESIYKPVVVDRLQKTEIAKLNRAVNEAKSLLVGLQDADRTKAELVDVPTNPEMIGVENSDIIGLGDYKYVVTQGDAKLVPKPPHMTGYAVYNQNQILAPGSFSLADLRKYNIQPVSRNAVIDALAPAKDLFEKQGYISFITESEQYGVIYKEKNKVLLKFVSENNEAADSYSFKHFNESLDRALDFFPLTSIEFTDGFSANMVDNEALKSDLTFKGLNALYETLIDYTENDNAELTKNIALDLLAKANELGFNHKSQSNDNVIQAVALVDSLNDSYKTSRFALLVGMDDNLTNAEQSLIKHAVALSESNALIQAEEPLSDEDDLITQLNATTLQNLNTEFALNNDALLFEEIVNSEPASTNQKTAEKALEDVKEQINEELIAESEFSNADLVKADTSSQEPKGAIKSGDTVTYESEGKPLFGYVIGNDASLSVVRYSYQDEYENLEKNANAAFLTFNGERVPAFAISKEEFKQSVKASGVTGNSEIDKIISELGSLTTLSTQELSLLANLTGVADNHTTKSELIQDLEDYFNVNQLGAIPSELYSDDDKSFIKKYFNDDTAIENVSSLTKELTTATSTRIIDKAFADANKALKQTDLNLNIYNHPNNTYSELSIDQVKNVQVITSKTLIETLSLPVEVIAAKTIHLPEEFNGLAQDIVTKADNLNNKNSLIAKEGSEVFVEHEGDIIKASLKNDLSTNAGTTSLVVESGDSEVQELDIPNSSLSIDIDEITNEAKSLFEQYLHEADNIDVSTILTPYERMNNDDGDDGLTYIYSRLLANKMLIEHSQALLDEAKTPNNYRLMVTADEYHIQPTDIGYTKPEFEGIGKFSEISDLNKAILIAKRDALGASQDDKTNELRSESTTPPEESLSDNAQGAVTKEPVGNLYTGDASENDRDGEQNQQENDGAVRVEERLHRELDSARNDKSRSPNGSKSTSISNAGVKLNPNVNYAYDENTIKAISSYKTESEAYDTNLNAIKLAKQLSKEKRPATNDEKNILASYRGWGGLAAIFDHAHTSHSSKRVELQELLSNDEYISLKRSTLSAFYTSPLLVNSVWNAMKHLGLNEGFGIDPAFGIGNFASAMPIDMQDKVTLQAKELDPLTAEIARHIHGPLIKNEGYEKAKIPSNTYDFAVGNIPFGDFKVYDPHHRDLGKHQIHDYFILKSLDKVKPGGFVSFITSSGTLDKKSDTVRELISKQADLVGALRLPTDAFSDNARTQVNSDILFFQKRLPESEPTNTNWLSVGEKEIPTSIHGGYEEKVEMNQYFIDNPEMIIGKQHSTSTRFGRRTYRTYLEGDLLGSINVAIDKLPKNIHFDFSVDDKFTAGQDQKTEITSGRRLGSYHLDSDKDVAIVIEKFEYNSETEEVDSIQLLEKCDLKKTVIPRMKSLIQLRDVTKSHIDFMLNNESNEGFDESLSTLNNLYDSHIKKFGPLNQFGNKSVFKTDPDASILLALEKWDKKEKKAEKADIFSERTVYPRIEITHTDSAEDALLISLSEKGVIDPAYIESLTKKEWPNLIAELGEKVFLNPQTLEWEHASTYLSGQVIDKLDIAKDAAANDEVFKHNVDSLEKIIPTPIPYYEIRAKLGSSWIPENDVRDFIKFIIKGDDSPCTPTEAQRSYKVAKVLGGWEVGISGYEVSVNSGRTKGEFGTEQWPADELISAIINSKSIGVYGKDNEGRRYLVADKTTEANAKADLIRDTFKQWLWEDPERAQRLENIYNRRNNGYVEPTFDGSKIEIKGLATTLKGKEFKPRKKQLDAIMRYLVTGRALFLHDVGVGKSFALLGSIMKGKEIGRHNKPMLAVPNPVFAQMQDLALSHFPSAKILMIDAKSLDLKNREQTLAQISTNSWDAVIVSHSITTRISVPDAFKLDLIDQEMSEVESAISSLEDGGFHGKLTIKAHQRKLENEKKKIEERMDSSQSYDTVNIEEMGIDALFIDEIDEFVNLNKVTNMGHVAGVNVKESAKARSLFYLTQYMHDKFNNQGIVGATGTDIRNNIGDQFTLLRYLAPDLLREQGIEMYDDFIGTFGEIQTQFEIAPEGTGFIEKTRLSKFYNLPELSMFYRQVADIVNAEDAGVERPKINELNMTSLPSPELELYMECLAQRAKATRDGSDKSDNLLAITNDGRKVAIDIRFLDARLPDYEDSKVNTCVKNVLSEYEGNKLLNPSQIIFSDIGVPNKDGRFNLYDDIKTKLIAGGIPEDKIVYARDFKTDSAKQELQDKMNTGEIAVTIGTTENMGVGKNVQERLVAIHDLSIPWRVRDLEQRGGRIERFGNIFDDATRYKYSTQDSFDLFIWNKLKQKALFAAQTKRTPRDAAREFDEEINPGYSEVMATLTGNPLIEESITLESKIDKLAMLERSHHRAKSSRMFEIGMLKDRIEETTEVINLRKNVVEFLGNFNTKLLGKPIESFEGDFSSASQVINKALNQMKKSKKTSCKFEVGEIDDKKLFVENSSSIKKLALVVEGGGQRYQLNEHHFAASLLKGLDNLEVDMQKEINQHSSQVTFFEKKVESLESVNSDVFPQGDELRESKQRLSEIQAEIAKAASLEIQENGSEHDPILRWENLIHNLENNEVDDELNDDKTILLKLD
tara:strand:- start:64476 stop:78212 length:13737 start_codon:yes stop_codon:yes gene_type:complete